MQRQRSGMTLRNKIVALIASAALAAATLAGADASAQETFPNKPINITVTFPPGGGTDILARLIGNYMSETLGHGAIVENKPGASGNVGAK
jgi:tripartite-type tricarboxylate transporter receptor subunit TctC